MEVKSSKTKKILIVFFAILGLVLPLFLKSCINLSNSSSINTSMEAKEYKMNIIVDEYGDMHVEEKIVVDNYTDRYNNYFYKEIAYNKNNMFGNSSLNTSNLVHDVRFTVEDYSGVVYDSEAGIDNYPYHFSGFSYNNDRDERGYRLYCEHSNPSNCDTIFYYNKPGFATITTFTYKYTIEGVVTQYNDISEFNWVLLDYQPFEFNDIEINITLPEGNYDIAEQETFFHGSGTARRKFIDDNKIIIDAKSLSKDEKIEVRLLLDNNLFNAVRENNKVNIDALNDILDFEKNQEKEADKNYLIGNVGAIIVLVVFVVILLVVIFICYNKHDKEFKSDFYNEYYRELPADYSPAVMGYLYKFREIDDDDLTATLLDLIRRKYLILDLNGSSNEDKNPNYIIMLNKDKSQNDLTESEKYLIKWFIKEIGDGEKVSSLQLSSFCDNYSGANKYQQSSNTWYRLVKSEASKYNFFEKENSNFKSFYSIVISLLAIITNFLLGFIYSNTGYVLGVCFIPTVIFFLVAAMLYIWGINRRSKKGNEDFVRWKAFKKFLEDFSSFEDYPVPSLIIWEHYLVYATSFGIADKVSEQLKLKFNLEQISSVDCTFMVYFGLDSRIGRFGRTIRGMRYMSRATVARYNAQRSGGSFGGRSGGGFSGGSSFGGGGGSFGGGRR